MNLPSLLAGRGILDPRPVSIYRAHMAALPSELPTQVGVREFRAHMGAYMERVAAGEAITLLSRGKPVAVVTPPASDPQFRKPGFLIGTALEHFELPEWTEEDLDELFYKPLEALD